MPVHSYIGDMMLEEAPAQLEDFNLGLFEMKVQGIDRTLADKVFAVCDYFMQNRVKKHSRHLYDIYKLLPIVPMDDDFTLLVKNVRAERAKTNICPSAQPGVDVPELLKTIIENDVFKEDYETITARILEEPIPYEVVIETLKMISETDVYKE